MFVFVLGINFLTKYDDVPFIYKNMVNKDTYIHTYPVIHAQETGRQSGMWSSIMPGLPRQVVQKLNLGYIPAV